MTAQTMGNVVSTGDQGESASSSPTIDGRPIMSVAHVQSWLSISDEAAAEVARHINELALHKSLWDSHYATEREANPSLQRSRRIREAFDVLMIELPELQRAQIAVKGVPSPEIEALYALIANWAPGFVPARQRGRPTDKSATAAKNLGDLIYDIWHREHPGENRSLKTFDGVVNQTLAWLGVERTDTAIAKHRSRKGQ